MISCDKDKKFSDDPERVVYICITIDTEGDSANNPHSTYLGIEIIIPQLIELFAKHNIQATFFIQEDEICQTGALFHDLWKSLLKQGHEIGYHAHGLIRAPFGKKQEIITNGIQKLNQLELNPESFRAGRFHFSGQLIKILESNNIKYDSSVVPGLRECFDDDTLRCDHVNSPIFPYFPSYENHCQIGDSNILELPINRYPKLPPNKWGGILEGSGSKEEILFDYFHEIRKDKLIIIAFHSWDGLSIVARKLVRKQQYGKLKKTLFNSMKRCIKPSILTKKGYIDQFDAFLKYVQNKNEIQFCTIREAGKKIIKSSICKQ